MAVVGPGVPKLPSISDKLGFAAVGGGPNE